MGLILCIIRTAMSAADEFGAYLACGVAVLFFTHVFINVGMTMRAAPIIGIPLPFVSYGGSFMLGTMLCAGLAQSVHVRRGLEREAD
jgi:rod shape determining protein RodA